MIRTPPIQSYITPYEHLERKDQKNKDKRDLNLSSLGHVWKGDYKNLNRKNSNTNLEP